MSLSYCDLINYSEYSIGSGSLTIDEIINNPTNFKSGIVGLTDEATLAGASDFIAKCKEKGLKAVVGSTVNVSVDGKNVGQLTLIAKNELGYQNISKIISSMGEYHNTKQRLVDFETILNHNENIYVIDGASNSILDSQFENLDRYKEILQKLRKTFGNNLMYTIQGHSSAKERERNKFIINKIRNIKNFNLKVLVSNNNRYLLKEHKPLFLNRALEYSSFKGTKDLSLVENYYCTKDHILSQDEISSTRKQMIDFLSSKDCLMTIDELKESIKDLDIFPEEPQIDKIVDTDLREVLRNKWKEYAPKIPQSEHKRYTERLRYELQIIEKMNYSSYFTLVYDIAAIAHELGYLTAIRGSGAGSLIMNVMGLSSIDPMKYNLMFERFLNPNRKELPDLDLEISNCPKVLEIISKKYGNVANLMKFSSLKSAGETTKFVINSLRRFGKGKDEQKVQATINRVDNTIEYFKKFLKKRNTEDNMVSNLIQNNNYWKSEYNKNKAFKQICDLAIAQEKRITNKGLNSGSVIISNDDFSKVISTFDNVKHQGTQIIAELTKHQKSYIKYDILSSVILDKNLKVLNSIEEDIKPHTERHDESKVYEMISKGLTQNLNQINGAIGTKMSQEIKPNSFEDLIAILALIRMGYVSEDKKPVEYVKFLEGKRNPSNIHYKHPFMKEILQETYGAILYEEQIMKIVMKVGGFDFLQADTIRSALKKKNPQPIMELKDLFINGAINKGINEELARDIYSDIEAKLNQFSFNKAHATAYADITYKQMYLKLHYPAEFMSAYVTKKNVDRFIEECSEMNVIVKRPSINESELNTLTTKLVSHNNEYTTILTSAEAAFYNKETYEKVLAERNMFGAYSDILDYTSRILPLYIEKNVFSPNISQQKIDEFKKETFNLIKIGAFDSLVSDELIHNIPLSREILKSNLDDIVNFVVKETYNEELELKIPSEVPSLDKVIEEEKELLICSPCEVNKKAIESNLKKTPNRKMALK